MRYNRRVRFEPGEGSVIIVRGLPIDLCLDFSNRFASAAETRSMEGDRLLNWLSTVGLVEVGACFRKDAQRTVDRAAKLCLAINDVFRAAALTGPVSSSALDVIAREARAGLAVLQVERAPQDGFVWTLGYDRVDPDQALAPIALSAAMLLAGPTLERVRLCANKTCGWLFIDHSKNRSRKWCDMADCGNKLKARRHYEKVRAAKTR